MKKKTIALLMAVVMLFGVTVGGTLAWLMAESEEVVNTFTFGDITIDLNETDNEDADTSTKANAYDLIPGDTAVKDPKVTVKANSENCYVFAKVTETNNYLDSAQIVQFDIDSHWELIETVSATEKIYVYTDGNDTPVVVPNAASDYVIPYAILATTGTGDAAYQIKVNENLTKDNIAAMAGSTDATTDDTYPIIEFDAAAVQSENITFAEAKTIAIGLLNATPNP